MRSLLADVAARNGSIVPAQMYIAGRWIDGADGTFDVLDPSTGTVIAQVPRAGVADSQRAISAAAAAQPVWAATAPRERAEILRRGFERVTASADELAFLMSFEMGKPLTEARGEATYAAEFLRWFSEEAVRADGTYRTAPAGTNKILTWRKPVGVALLLTPWNFPAAMITRKVAPALAAGCAVVLKPAEDTPLTALALAGLLEEAGVPAGVLNVVTTDRPAALVATALADPRIRKLSFTGSTSVGSLLLKQAADRIVNCSMELGGNDPFLVLADADVDQAVAGAMLAKIRNGGQACTAANRFLVHESLAGEFATKLATAMAGLRMGAATTAETQIGPMINARAVTGIADKVDRSISAGASALLGGRTPAGAGFFYPPTVLTDVPRDSAVAIEEIFGPVAPVIAVHDDDDAIALANATEMGLAAYVYSRSLSRGLAACERLEVGMVGLNRGVLSDAAAPFGGVKQSGLGREGGYEGIDEYLETVYVATDF